MHQTLKDLPKITFDLLNRIYQLKGWGSLGKSWTKICYQNTLSPNYYKPNKNKTISCYKYKLMRQSIGIANLQKIFITCFVTKYLKPFSMQKLFMEFDYSYSYAPKFKRWLPVYFTYFTHGFRACVTYFSKQVNVGW